MPRVDVDGLEAEAYDYEGAWRAASRRGRLADVALHVAAYLTQLFGEGDLSMLSAASQ